MKIQHKVNEKKKKKKELPSIEDQLAAIWIGGETMEDMRKKIQLVNAKYSKK